MQVSAPTTSAQSVSTPAASTQSVSTQSVSTQASTKAASTARAADGDYKTKGLGHEVKDSDGDYKPQKATPPTSAAATSSTSVQAALLNLVKGG